MNVWEAIVSLERFIYDNRFQGYEPYDGLNTKYKVLKCNKYARLCLTHGNRLFPWNMRRCFGIRPYAHTKTLGLMMKAYPMLYRIHRSESYREKYNECKAMLFDNQLPEGGWGGSYDCQFRNRLARKHAFSMMGTVLVCEALLLGASAFGYDKDAKTSFDILDKVLIGKYVRQTNHGVSVTYAEGESRYIVNIHAFVGGLLSQCHRLSDESRYLELAIRIFDQVLDAQYDNGAWPYSEGDDFHSTQLDFHQGFVLCGLAEFVENSRLDDTRYVDALIRGARFYKKRQFLLDGRGKFRYPTLYPIDIHNQSQGLLTFSKLARYEPEFATMSKTIAQWTLQNMRARKGCFHYCKGWLFTSRIPYMAWGQAWMLLALIELVANNDDRKGLSLW